MTGSGPTELRVEPDPDALARHGIPASRLADRVAAANRTVAAGTLLSAEGARSAVRENGGGKVGHGSGGVIPLRAAQ